jgi:hypothetical protein
VRKASLPAALLLALSAAGCGLGAGSGVKAVSVTVTSDFGARSVGSARAARTPGGETVMRFLQRRFDVRTRYGGGFVQSIDGLSGGGEGGRVDWFYYVNGVEAPKGAAATRLHPGDRVWWDRHDWSTAMSVPAVVGSFPEPFRSGLGGRRLPVQVACAPQAQSACQAARGRLAAAGVAFGQAGLGAPAGVQSLRLLVGPWATLRADPSARRLEQGPGNSGVFARFDAGGSRLQALDPRGRSVRTLGAGTGLVAATGGHDRPPTWLVTGTDAAGTLAAARALDEGDQVPRRMSELYRRRRDLVCDALREIGVDVTPPKGTIYVWAPVPEGHTSASYCELVLDQSGVALSPGGAYGQHGEGFFRISLTVPDERLAEAVERLRDSLAG